MPIKLVLKRVQEFLPFTGVNYTMLHIFYNFSKINFQL